MARFSLAFFGEIGVPPACETVFEVPGGLSVPDKGEFGHGVTFFKRASKRAFAALFG